MSREVILESNIINRRKEIYLDVTQSRDFVLPNGKYEYKVYLKNISGLEIKNVELFITKPGEAVYIQDTIPWRLRPLKNGQTEEEKSPCPEEAKDKDCYQMPDETNYQINDFDTVPTKLGDLQPGESRYLKFRASATRSGFFNVTFICRGENTEVVTQSLQISCGFVKREKNTIHRIGFYNFDPYESSYRLSSRYYNPEVTQLMKVQAKPFLNSDEYFKISTEPIDYRDQVLAQQNEDNLPIGYIGREYYDFNEEELYSGAGIEEVIKKVNDNSELVHITHLRNGSGALDNDFAELYPQSFINRFSLLTSEIYHRLGVFPQYSYVADNLMRWSHNDEFLDNVYPNISRYNWSVGNKYYWPGEGFVVWQLVKEPFKTGVRTKLEVFTTKEDARTYIRKLYEFDYYHDIWYHYYYYTTRLYVNGVFYVHIPIKDIPSNFFFLNSDDLNPIIEKTKPFGLKGLLRYIVSATFTHHHEFNPITRFKPQLPIEDDWNNKILYCIRSKRYIVDEEGNISLVDFGQSALNRDPFDHNHLFKPTQTKPIITLKDHKNDIGDESFHLEYEKTEDVEKTIVDKDYTDPDIAKELLESNNNTNLSYYKDIVMSKEISISELGIKSNIEVPPTEGHISYSAAKRSSSLKTNYFKIRYDSTTNSFSCSNTIDNQVITKACDEITITKGSDIHEHVEVGISLNGINKDHVVSFESVNEYETYIAKYCVYYGGKYDTIDETISEVDGVSVKLYRTKDNQTLAVFYRLRSYVDEEGLPHYYKEYMTHNTIVGLSSFFIYARNTHTTTEKSTIHIAGTGADINGIIGGNDSKYNIVYDTPEIYKSKEIDSYEIAEVKINNDGWTNVYRMDKELQSFAYIDGKYNNQHVNTLVLYSDYVDIPDDCYIEQVGVRTAIDSTTKADIACQLDYNNNYGIENDYGFKKILKPNDIDVFADGFYSSEYLEYLKLQALEDYEIEMFELYNTLQKKTIAETEATGISLNNINIYKPFWCNVDFKNKFNDIILTDVAWVEFKISGYNYGPQTKMRTRICSETSINDAKNTYINSGAFEKKIKLFGPSDALVSELFVQFMFEKLNHHIEIFDMELSLEFNEPQDFIQWFDYDTNISTQSNETIYTKLNVDDAPIDGNLFKNGLTLKLDFRDINKGDSIKIYSFEIEFLYRLKNSSIFIKDVYPGDIAITGKANNNYVCGHLFGDSLSCEQLDYNDTYNDEPYNGFELSEGVYQSFIAHNDTITSIEIFPNGIVGHPSNQIELSIFDDIHNVPGELISRTYISEWDKVDTDELKDPTIKFPIHAQNLKENERYWFALRVIGIKDGNYYLLKATTSPREGYKCLHEIDGNLQNTNACLAFKINSEDSNGYFSSLPRVIDNKGDYLKINLVGEDTELENLRIKKLHQVD